MRPVRSRASEASRGGAPAHDDSGIGNVTNLVRPFPASRNACAPFPRPAMRTSRNHARPAITHVPQSRASRNHARPAITRPAITRPAITRPAITRARAALHASRDSLAPSSSLVPKSTCNFRKASTSGISIRSPVIRRYCRSRRRWTVRLTASTSRPTRAESSTGEMRRARPHPRRGPRASGGRSSPSIARRGASWISI